MMFVKVFSTAFKATSLMTFFSYMVSTMQKENFKEPKLLGGMVKNVFPGMNETTSYASGWLIHYSLGLTWTIVQQLYMKANNRTPSIPTAIGLGVVSGVTGVAVWHLLFKVLPHPPRTNRKKFYGQLMVAHLVFSSIVVAEEARKSVVN